LFRPNIGPGIRALGEPIDDFYYVAMFANSLKRFNQGLERLDAATTFGGAVWWELRGSFGPGPSDVESHKRPTPRIGTSVAISREQNQSVGPTGLNNPKDTILRLSDGTPLFRDGALAPGVGLSRTSDQLWAIDASINYRGLAVNGEYFLRWLDDFKTVGGPVRSILTSTMAPFCSRAIS